MPEKSNYNLRGGTLGVHRFILPGIAAKMPPRIFFKGGKNGH